jgi:hypothetical protein
MTNPNPDRLEDLCACRRGLDNAATFPTLREWWAKTGRGGDMLWLVDRAYSHGSLGSVRARAVLGTDALSVFATAAVPADVIRASITIDEVCASLNLNPDQGVT